MFSIPKRIVEETNWARSHQKEDIPYEKVKVKVEKVSRVLSKNLQAGDTFSFYNPATTENLQVYKVKRVEDFRCLVFKIN